MAIKDILCRFRPAQLYIVLALSVCYFCIQMVLSHITHALTLLLSSYHMLCNIFALTGCIITIKNNMTNNTEKIQYEFSRNFEHKLEESGQKFTCVNLSTEEKYLRNIECRERKLRNTFGWARIDVLTMLIVCIILASLSFSLLVEALQTLIHIDHQDSMHLPIAVMVLGFIGLIINGITYLLIGGYTRHQGSFLQINFDGNVIMDDKVNSEFGSSPVLQVENTFNDNIEIKEYKEDFIEMFRDISSTIFVIVCAFIVYMSNDEHTAKFIDPVLSIFSCVVLGTLSYPYMKESCLILLQTIPGSIDIEIFEQTLTSKFPEIISFHDLHIWQLTAKKFVSTVHIKFKSQKLYIKIIEDIRIFFLEQGITIVTIQPEFEEPESLEKIECLVKCNAKTCAEKVCCQQSYINLCHMKTSTQNDRLHINTVSLADLHEASVADSKILKQSQSVVNISSELS